MPRRLLSFLALFLLVAGAVSARNEKIPTPQARSSHMLTFLDKGQRDSICTGTAIGPHAILTAEHCNPHDQDEAVEIDFSPNKYRILAACHDGRDHVIYLLDGPAFLDIDAAISRTPVAGEKTYFYGFGRQKYPAVRKNGRVVNSYDPSEVDRSSGLHYFTNNAIPGDSGSAIYGSDGAILGLVTWSLDRSDSSMGGYELAFSQADIAVAKSFGVL